MKPQRDPKATILLVEDDTDIRESLVELLEGEGYAVLAAQHGREALAHLEQATPSAIVLDLMMPVMGGLEFIDALEREGERHAVPIVLLTASNAKPTGARLRRIAQVLQKPIDVDVLLAVLARTIATTR